MTNIGNESLGSHEPFSEFGEAKKTPFRSIRTLFPDPNPFLTSYKKRTEVLEMRDQGRTRTSKRKIRPKFPRCLSPKYLPAENREVFMGLSRIKDDRFESIFWSIWKH